MLNPEFAELLFLQVDVDDNGVSEPRHEKTCLRGFRPGPTLANRVVKSQKMVRCLKSQI